MSMARRVRGKREPASPSSFLRGRAARCGGSATHTPSHTEPSAAKSPDREPASPSSFLRGRAARCGGSATHTPSHTEPSAAKSPERDLHVPRPRGRSSGDLYAYVLARDREGLADADGGVREGWVDGVLPAGLRAGGGGDHLDRAAAGRGAAADAVDQHALPAGRVVVAHRGTGLEGERAVGTGAHDRELGA